MTIYHVDRFYGKDDGVYYDVSPYSFKGTLSLYFGFDLNIMKWRYHFCPWYRRFIEPVKWFRMAHFSETAAKAHAKRINEKSANYFGDRL